jgi:hypothetical protein
MPVARARGRGHSGGPRTKEGRPFLGGFCTPSRAACCPAFPEAAPSFPVPVPNVVREGLRAGISGRWVIPFTMREDQLAWQQGENNAQLTRKNGKQLLNNLVLGQKQLSNNVATGH